MKTTRQQQRSRAGRRAGQTGNASRQAILDAARTQFARDGFRATTLRTIADAAGVTPAMIPYHFGNKRKLFFAVVASIAEPMLQSLGGKKDAPADLGLSAFFEIYMRTIAAHPDIPSLIMHDILGTHGDMRGEFAQRFAHRGRDLMTNFLKNGQAGGLIDPEIDVDLGVISLLSLALFPFLAAPLIREVFGLEWNDETLDRLVEHQRALFFNGATSPRSTR